MQLFFSPFAIPIVAVLGVFVWLSIAAVSDAVRRIVKNRDEVELKQTLAERGMSADEIERIILASGSEEKSKS